jgi:hypothetical protein
LREQAFKFTGVQGFKRVEFGCTFAKPFLESFGTGLGFFVRAARQLVLDALLEPAHPDRATLTP